jgi:hypothetical protein
MSEVKRRTSKKTTESVPDFESQSEMISNENSGRLSRELNHGLEIPRFEANELLANDLFTNSSSLPETEKHVADGIVDSIDRKRQTIRIVKANVALNTEAIHTETDSNSQEVRR